MSLIGTIKPEKSHDLIIQGTAKICVKGEYALFEKVKEKNIRICIKELNNYLVPVLNNEVLMPLHYENSVYSMEKLCKGDKSPVSSYELMGLIRTGDENQLLTYDRLGFGLNVASDLNCLSKSLIKYSLIKNGREEGLSDEMIKSLLASNGFKPVELEYYERMKNDWELLTHKWHRLGLLKI